METRWDGCRIDRRQLFRAALALGLVGSLPTAQAAPRVQSKARIIILGGGAAGLATASRLMQRLDGASITLVDARKAHYYQPGFTLVAAGLKSADYTVSETQDYLPNGVAWRTAAAAEIDPIARKVGLSDGSSLPYDFLVVAVGLRLDYEAIEGMSPDLIGQNGIGSVYGGPEAAAATWRAMSVFADQGGVGLFGRPATEMKCAGAPLKYAFITDDYLRRRGNRGRAKLIYAAQNTTLFSVPIVSEKVRMLFGDRDVTVAYNHVISALDPVKKIATYTTPAGRVEMGFDFINVVPPIRPPDVVRKSPLAWQSGPFAADGWMEVDMASLRHKRFPEIFGVGDIAGVPKGKTAASVKWQAPVMVDHLIASITGGTSTSAYNGYTSCPLITRLGRAMLVEFDYNNNLVPSFPGVIAPLEELWVTWVMKEIALKPTYLAMLRGQA